MTAALIIMGWVVAIVLLFIFNRILAHGRRENRGDR